MKHVGFLFHIYQPPVQDQAIVAKIVRESYRPLTRIFRRFSGLKFTLNINYSLVRLLDSPFPDVIDNIKAAYENGNLELTATGAYHPIFPLIPLREVKRQIELNEEGNRDLLSRSFRPQGVFPPELAFTDRLVSLFKSMGYKWTIADDSNLHYYGTEVPYNKIYSFDDFAILLRSNLWANRFANHKGQWRHGEDFVAELLASLNSWMGTDDGYVIIALDGETFGHHHPELNERFLRELFEALQKADDHLCTAHLSDICCGFPRVPHLIPPGSWSTDEANLAHRDYFSWWKSPENKVHQLQWQLTSLVLQKVRELHDPEMDDETDKALYSCQYWWASCWKFDRGEIYKGAFNLMRLLQKAMDRRNDTRPEGGEKIFRELVTEIEREHHERERRQRS